MDNRRVHDRVQEVNRVAVTILKADAAPELVNSTLFCPTEDLSVDGLRLRSPRLLPAGALLVLRIALLKPLRAFTHQGVAAWSRPVSGTQGFFDLGIRFTQLQPGCEAAWHALIARKLALLHPPEPVTEEEEA